MNIFLESSCFFNDINFTGTLNFFCLLVDPDPGKPFLIDLLIYNLMKVKRNKPGIQSLIFVKLFQYIIFYHIF